MAANPIQALKSDVAQTDAQAQARQTALNADQAQMLDARGKELQPLQDRTSAAIDKQIAMEQAPPKQQPLPEYQPKPLVDAKEYQGLAMGLIAMAMIGGVASKGNWLGASASLNGALKGFLEGSEASAKKEYEDYKTKFDAAKAKNQAALDEYDKILNNNRLTINDMIAQTKLVAAKYDDQAMRFAAEQKSIDQMVERRDKMEMALANISDRDERLREQLNAKLAEGGGDDPKIRAVRAAMTDRGVSFPTGMRSEKAQVSNIKGLLEKHPDDTPDQIAERIRNNELEYAADRKEITTAAGVAGRVAVAQKEIRRFAPLVAQISAKVPRGKFVPINELLQTGEKNVSDPDLKELKIKITGLLNAYDQLAARGGTDKHKREEAHAMLTSADSHKALMRGLRSFMQEADAAEQAAIDAETPRPRSAEPAAPTTGKSYKHPSGATVEILQ